MLELHAASFYRVTSTLITLRQRIGELARSGIRNEADGTMTFLKITDPETVNYLSGQSVELIENLRTLGTKTALMSASKLLAAVSEPAGFQWNEVIRLGDEIHGRLVDELSLVKAFVLEDTKAVLYEPPDPLFGLEVAAKFPTEAAFEIDEAAKCLALNRPTAAVFHLMRTLEVAIRAVARCLQIPDPLKPAERNWGFILGEIAKGINTEWPGTAARMSGDGMFFESLRASLEAVRNPWRNATMHVEKKYTEDEAEHVFVAVKGFMKTLASRCDENGEPRATV
jgi:hypothetical protein